MESPRLSSLLVKPAGPDCNMRCGYCFYLDRAALWPDDKKHRMTPEVLEELILQAMEQSSGEISFAWQGGEPTLTGLEFFERAVELQQRYGHGQVVDNSLQTNGLKLGPKWAAFLARYNFLVGLSLDGPARLHDHYRRKLGGQGSHRLVESKARMLLDAGVQVNALCCVTDRSAGHAGELFDYFAGLGLDWMQFIPIVEHNPALLAHAATVSPERYGAFLCELFDRWRADFEDGLPRHTVRLFESLLFSYLGEPPPDCTLQPTCGGYLVVEHDGGVYSCDFYVDPGHRLGDIGSNRLADMLTSAAQRDFGARKAALNKKCLACPWLARCRGGCPKDRLAGEPTHLCAGLEVFFEHADPFFKELARNVAARRSGGGSPPPGPRTG